MNINSFASYRIIVPHFA